MFDLSQPNEKPGACRKCHGTGIYYFGAVINGKPTRSGECFSCRGTGNQDRTQILRNETYNRYKIAEIFHADLSRAQERDEEDEEDEQPEKLPHRSGATCVVCDGPYPDQDREGEEIPVWSVFVADDDGNEIGKVYKCYSQRSAESLAAKIAKDRRLELVRESAAF